MTQIIEIPIEMIVILFLIGVFFFWSLWFNISRRRLKKKYKPENDKSRGGKIPERVRGTEGGEPTTSITDQSIERLAPTSEPELLPTTDADKFGKNDNSVGKNRKGIRRFLGRRK